MHSILLILRAKITACVCVLALSICASKGAIRSISADVLGSTLTISTDTTRYAGAISSMTWRGKQFVDTTDHGRLFQTAVFVNGYVECYNPTEAGSRDDSNSSSSQLLSVSASGNVLHTRTNMAFYLHPGETGDCGNGATTAMNPPGLSGYVLDKTVTIGFAGIPNVIEYVASITLPDDVNDADVVIAAYAPRSLSWERDFYVRNQAFSDLIRSPDYNTQATGYGNYVASLFDPSAGVGVSMYSPEMLQPYLPNSNPYLQWVMFPPDPGYPYPASVFVGQFPGRPYSAGTTIKARAYLIVGNYDEMTSALNQLHYYYRDFDPDVFDFQQYLNWYPDVAAAYPGQNDAEFHWSTYGIGEGRSASTIFYPWYYLQKYPDVAAYCGGPSNYQCAIDHYVAWGRLEGRTGY